MIINKKIRVLHSVQFNCFEKSIGTKITIIVLLQNPILAQELGIKEWELQDPDFKRFYEWLGNNITAENILTEEEQQSYDAIPSDERLEGAALQQEMDRIEKKYPGIMDVTPELVARKNEELAQLTETLAVYQKIADDLQ